MQLAIVIPAFNEEEKIRSVLRGVFSLCPEALAVVVDDGSIDATAAVSREVGAIVLRHVVNRGQGAALVTGTEYALRAGAEIIAHFDADGQMEPADIGRLVQPVAAGEVQVTLGSRFLQSNQIPWTKKRMLLPLARLVNFLFTGLWLNDVHNGLRVLSRQAAQAIVITQDRMAHNSEIVRQIRQFRLSFREMPVTIHYYGYGQGLGGGIKIVKDLILDLFLR